nr:hypothetical protein [Tanacetum cinerariifolium]
FKEDLFASCVENGILQDSFGPSNDNSNVANALREPFVVNLDPGNNSSQSPPQISNHYCYGCGNPLKGIFCHQCTCKLCGNGARYGYNCPAKVSIIPDSEPFNNQTVKELPPTVQSFDPKSDLVHNSPNFPVIHQPPQEMSIKEIEDLKQQYLDEMKCLINSEYRDEIKIDELKGNFNSMSIEINKKEKLQQLEQVANLSTYPSKHFNSFCYDDDDDDDEDYAIAFTPSLSTEEPDNSLSMGDEHLDTIPTMEADEFTKSSVENLVPIPSESEGESECDVPIDPHHFNAETDLIESLLNNDSSIIPSSKIDSLFDEFAGELTLLKSISPGINETDCYPEEETHYIKRLLYDNSSPPPEEFVSANSDTEIKSFSLMKEIDLSFTPDYPMPPGIEEDDYDSKRDILILKDFLSNDTLSLPKIESFYFDILSFSRPHAKPPDEKSPDLLSHRGLKAFQPFAKRPMMIHGKNTPILGVPLFHFYPH